MSLATDDIVVTETIGQQEHHSYVDWAAVIAGIVLASAISLVLLAFGTAIGLSFTNFRTFEGVAPIWVAIAAASWLLWVEVSSFMAGGYLAGRMRRRFNDATEHESDVRDGAHGLLVWAGALVVGAIIATGGVSAVASAIGSAASTVTNAAATVADDAGEAVDGNAYFVDQLFRLPEGTTAPPATGTDYRAEAARIFAQSAISGSTSDADRLYLAQLVAANTGLTTEEATARVNEVETAVANARTEALEVAEAARKTAVIAAFLTAASLLVSAVGAYWAAMKGGNHRDKATVFAGVFGRF